MFLRTKFENKHKVFQHILLTKFPLYGLGCQERKTRQKIQRNSVQKTLIVEYSPLTSWDIIF